MKDHQTSLPAAVFGNIVYSDDKLSAGSLSDYSAASRLAGIREAMVPARVSASWVDGTTADSALDRFVGAPDVPMEVVIGATTHPAGLDADPFAQTPFAHAKPSGLEQFQADLRYTERHFY
jgi:predicted acyl esterase